MLRILALLRHRLLLVLLLCFSMVPASAQDSADEIPEFLPGLLARITTGDRIVQQIDSDVLFDWGQTPPTVRLPDGDFSANWQGLLQAKENGQFQLSVYACGKVQVSLAGQQILDEETQAPGWLHCKPVELRFGMHELQVDFQKTQGVARLALYWSGPSFALEPISGRALFHRSEQTLDRRFDLGQTLSRGLRCAACHEFTGGEPPLAAPALTHLQDNLRPSWLVDRLMSQPEEALASGSMPHFGMHRNDALAITAALFAASAPSAQPEDIAAQLAAANKKRPKKEPEIRSQADRTQGEMAFVSTGCLACHAVGELGRPRTLEQQLFGGGELTHLAVKRTEGFVKRWLADPRQLNTSHRMPVFDLTLLERLDLAAYLSQLGQQESRQDTQAAGDAARGVGLISRYRCGTCHQLPDSLTTPIAKTKITTESNWSSPVCLGQPVANQTTPGFGISDEQRDALQLFNASIHSLPSAVARGKRLMSENNCTACHNREMEEGLKGRLADIVAAVPDVALRLGALAPPSLNAVGDKLHTHSLRSAISQQAPRLRPWLDVRMPKFHFDDEQLDDIVAHMIAHDRIPDGGPQAPPTPPARADDRTLMAAGRLVTAEGFGCQSCHQIGDTDPPKVDLNARGTNLAMLGERIRPSWFDRWVRNPARIVPRMEMPAIQTPVKGVLDDSLDQQLGALWTTLNTPDFRPPRPAPVRIVRTHNLEEHTERAWLLTDVIETTERVHLRPLVFGLPNRQSLLFDLESGKLSTWWLGDIAHQHTRGKSWFWEPGATPLVAGDGYLEQISLIDSAGVTWNPTPLGQFAARFDRVEHIENGIEWSGRLHLTAAGNDSAERPARWVSLRQTVWAESKGAQAVSKCTTRVSGLMHGDRIQVSSAMPVAAAPRKSGPGWLVDLRNENTHIEIASQASIEATAGKQAIQLVNAARSIAELSWTSSYRSLLPTDQFPYVDVQPMGQQMAQPLKQISVVPGYEGIQLPLPPTEMPISFAWDKSGACYVGSLKGRVLRLKDSDRDGLAEQYELISDEFPTPFGLFVSEEGIDALTKFALIRLTEPKQRGVPYTATVVADGWGYTADYHDWAVGLERDDDHNYYLALPCQQDDRTAEAAYLRGQALKLIPHLSQEEPRKYRIEPFAAGLRFPMGIALNDQQALFTSDNQGNYNPFNELNHLRFGKRYGFINKLENKDGFSPESESPAINLPHPWTRSVNGICFLKTPVGLPSTHFGPYEGHLIGCEMNGKALVRMSFQKVGETYQGAAYLFSRPVTANEANFEGPIVCEVSPAGELFIGSLQDSGWSAGQNTGSIVRLRPSGQLPPGIAEVRATATGFEVEFTQPIDREKAAMASNYLLRSYRRVATPAYGGDDQDERNERIKGIQLSNDAYRVTLAVDDLRAGYVYELNVGPIAQGAQELFPSQAHYSLRALIP